jgi:hypothetical protein
MIKGTLYAMAPYIIWAIYYMVFDLWAALVWALATCILWVAVWYIDIIVEVTDEFGIHWSGIEGQP